MDVVVNGQGRTLPEGETIPGLLQSLGLDGERVAVELDGKIVKRGDWPGRELRPGARVEIVHFVGGG